MTLRLDEHGFEQRRATIVAMLDRVGETEVLDEGADDDERVLTATARAPLDPPYQLGSFEYVEVYARGEQGRWELTEYAYELQQRPPPGRRAFHWHDPWAHHFHCLDPRSPERDHHYRGYELDLFEAHRELLRIYASATIDCSGLHPLFR